MASKNTNLEKHDVEVEHRDDIENGPVTPNTHTPIVLHKKDVVALEAIGGAYEELPHGYYWSKDFLGTLTVRCYPNATTSAVLTTVRLHV